MKFLDLPAGHHLNPEAIIDIECLFRDGVATRVKIVLGGNLPPITFFDDAAARAWAAIEAARSPEPDAIRSTMTGLEDMVQRIDAVERVIDPGCGAALQMRVDLLEQRVAAADAEYHIERLEDRVKALEDLSRRLADAERAIERMMGDGRASREPDPSPPIDPDTPRRIRITARDGCERWGTYYPSSCMSYDETGAPATGSFEWIDPEPGAPGVKP